MFDRDDIPTRPYPMLAPEPTKVAIRIGEVVEGHDTLEDVVPGPSALCSSLPVPAARAYELFCDSERIPEWMAVIRSSRVIATFEDGRARRTAFIARLERASMGYTLEYTYDDQARSMQWSTSVDATTVIAGRARFQELGSKACMMHYELDLRSVTILPAWGDPMYNGHPASSVLSDFREFVSRNRE